MTKPPLASMSISPEVTENPQDLCVEPHHCHSDAEGRTPRLRCWGLVAHTLLGVVKIYDKVHGGQHHTHR